MFEEEGLPDFYAILQVHPKAEPEIIEAAYRRLMHKYHPDRLPPDQRDDPEVLSRVRSINLAYDLLSDPAQRAAYDATIKESPKEPAKELNPDIETRIHLVRCARTKQDFRMLLGRKKGKSKLFRVLGFEPGHSPSQTPQRPALPAPASSASIFRRLLARLNPEKHQDNQTSAVQPHFPSSEDINKHFDESVALSFSEIDFSGWKCPACNGEHLSPDGILSHWCRCSACARIYCAGDVNTTNLGDITHCPWCGRRARITIHVKPGDNVDMPVKGKVGGYSRSGPKAPRIADTNRRSLPDKK